MLLPRPDLGAGPPGAGNLLLLGDNLPGLRALAHSHAGAFAAAYLDPPYNTGGTFEHYADRQRSADWAEALRARLERLPALLRPDGLLFLQIDDNEHARAQLLLDGVFGAHRRLNTVVIKMSELSGVKMTHADRSLPKLKEYLLIYGNGPAAALRPVRQPKTGAAAAAYLRYYTRFIDNPADPAEGWRLLPLRAAMAARGLDGADPEAVRAFQLAHADRCVYRTNNRLLAGLSFPTATARVRSPQGISYVWWEGKQMLFLADHLDEPLGDLWTDLSTINLNKEGGVRFRNGKKPEALIERVLRLSTAPGDLVLDPYAGSGTTGAVAHKMGRRWVLIEAGPHGAGLTRDRLAAVVAGADPGGVTRASGWAGGGGFDVAAVAP